VEVLWQQIAYRVGAQIANQFSRGAVRSNVAGFDGIDEWASAAIDRIRSGGG
jgi:hypothetical protein